MELFRFASSIVTLDNTIIFKVSNRFTSRLIPMYFAFWKIPTEKVDVFFGDIEKFTSIFRSGLEGFQIEQKSIEFKFIKEISIIQPEHCSDKYPNHFIRAVGLDFDQSKNKSTKDSNHINIDFQGFVIDKSELDELYKKTLEELKIIRIQIEHLHVFSNKFWVKENLWSINREVKKMFNRNGYNTNYVGKDSILISNSQNDRSILLSYSFLKILGGKLLHKVKSEKEKNMADDTMLVYSGELTKAIEQEAEALNVELVHISLFLKKLGALLNFQLFNTYLFSDKKKCFTERNFLDLLPESNNYEEYLRLLGAKLLCFKTLFELLGNRVEEKQKRTINYWVKDSFEWLQNKKKFFVDSTGTKSQSIDDTLDSFMS